MLAFLGAVFSVLCRSKALARSFNRSSYHWNSQTRSHKKKKNYSSSPFTYTFSPSPILLIFSICPSMSTFANSPDAPDEESESEYAADFTSEQASTVVTCKRCLTEYPAGTKLRLMHSKRHGGSDRFFCSKCFEHYRNKETTIRRPAPTRTPGTSNRHGMHKLESSSTHFPLSTIHFSLSFFY